MIEFQIGQHNYKAGKLNAFQQLHVARRLAPVLTGLKDVLQGGLGRLKANPLEAVVPLAEALSAMKDEDTNYIVTTCLGVVQRQQAQNLPWASVTTPQGDLLFDDIDMLVMVQIVWRVLEGSVMGFSNALQAFLPNAAGAGQP